MIDVNEAMAILERLAREGDPRLRAFIADLKADGDPKNEVLIEFLLACMPVSGKKKRRT
jgi:hypothetical protein